MATLLDLYLFYDVACILKDTIGLIVESLDQENLDLNCLDKTENVDKEFPMTQELSFFHNNKHDDSADFQAAYSDAAKYFRTQQEQRLSQMAENNVDVNFGQFWNLEFFSDLLQLPATQFTVLAPKSQLQSLQSPISHNNVDLTPKIKKLVPPLSDENNVVVNKTTVADVEPNLIGSPSTQEFRSFLAESGCNKEKVITSTQIKFIDRKQLHKPSVTDHIEVLAPKIETPSFPRDQQQRIASVPDTNHVEKSKRRDIVLMRRNSQNIAIDAPMSMDIQNVNVAPRCVKLMRNNGKKRLRFGLSRREEIASHLHTNAMLNATDQYDDDDDKENVAQEDCDV